MVSRIGDLSRGGRVPPLLLDLGRAFTLRHSRYLREDLRVAPLPQGLEVLLGRVPRRVVRHLGACFVGFAKISRPPLPRARFRRGAARTSVARARASHVKVRNPNPRRASCAFAVSGARGVSLRASRNGAASRRVHRTWRFRARSTPRSASGFGNSASPVPIPNCDTKLLEIDSPVFSFADFLETNK